MNVNNFVSKYTDKDNSEQDRESNTATFCVRFCCCFFLIFSKRCEQKVDTVILAVYGVSFYLLPT